MSATASSRGRLLAVGLLALALVAAAASVVLPARWLDARYDRMVSEQRDQLARYQRLAGQRDAIEAALAAAKARDGGASYLKANSATLAGAELQTMVTQLLEANGGRIQTSQVQPADKDAKSGEPLRVTVSAQVLATPTSLLAMVHAVESASPYLFIDQLTVRSLQNRRARAPAGGAVPSVDVDVRLTVSAYARQTAEGKAS